MNVMEDTRSATTDAPVSIIDEDDENEIKPVYLSPMSSAEVAVILIGLIFTTATVLLYLDKSITFIWLAIPLMILHLHFIAMIGIGNLSAKQTTVNRATLFAMATFSVWSMSR